VKEKRRMGKTTVGNRRVPSFLPEAVKVMVGGWVSSKGWWVGGGLVLLERT